MSITEIFALLTTAALALGWYGCTYMRQLSLEPAPLLISCGIATGMLALSLACYLVVEPCDSCEEPHLFAMFVSVFGACGAGILLNAACTELRNWTRAWLRH